MAGEKYVVAAAENSLQIAVRNILNPNGYTFSGNCSDAVSLIRLVRSHQPDFIIVDAEIQLSEAISVLETIDDDLLCACILLGESRNTMIFSILEKSKAISYCPKPLNRDVFLQTVEMANLNFRRVQNYGRRLKEITQTDENRKVIDRAKLILMERDGLSEKNAYEYMRKKSMNLRLTLREIAETIICAGGKN